MTAIRRHHVPGGALGACALAVIGSVVGGSLLLAAAIAAYPGGSARDPDARGFDARDNYVCDLLHATALGGQPNPAAPLARASLVLFAAGLVPFFLLLPALFPDRPAPGRFVRATGVASALGWIAVALTPSDRFGAGHAAFVLVGIVPGVTAAAVAVRELARRRGHGALALLGACALAWVGIDGALFFVLLATRDASLAVFVPMLQKLALASLIAWMLCAAVAALRPAVGDAVAA